MENNPESISGCFLTIPALLRVEKIWSRVSCSCNFSLL